MKAWELDRADVVALVTEIKKAYLQIHKAGLDDLEVFCRAKKTCVVPGDHDRTMVLEGRREVWLRIMAYRDMEIHELIRTFDIGERNG